METKTKWNHDTQFVTGRLGALTESLQGQIQDAPAVGESQRGSLGAMMALVAGDSPVAKTILEEDGGSPVSVPFAVAHEDIQFIESLDYDDAPWAHLFNDVNVGIALEYGFALGLRFAHEEQQRKNVQQREAQILDEMETAVTK